MKTRPDITRQLAVIPPFLGLDLLSRATAMPSVPPLDNFLGAGFIGIVMSTVIYGITCLQTHSYYTKYSGNDPWAMKFVVALLWVLDSFHLALVAIMIYHYTVTNWGNVVVLGRTTWSLELSIMIGTLLTLIVQCFFARRIWRLSGKNWALTGTIVVLSLFQLGFGTAFMVHGFQTQFFDTTGSKANKFITGTALSGDIACDIVITVSMCYYLQRSRTGFKGTNTMINMLITYAIRTCLLTTVCTVSCLVTFIVFPDTMIYSPFYFIACRLYANSLLSTLNARESIADKSKPQGSDIISLGRFVGSSTYTANDGNGTIGSPDQWVSPGTYNQPHGRSEVYDGTEKLSV